MKHCHHCGKDFATPSSLKRHFSAKHSGEIDGRGEKDKRHSCPQCHQDFTRRESLRRHIRSKHDHDLSLCSFCLKQFRADYVSQHRPRCACRYLKRVQQHASIDDSTGTAQFKSAPKSIQLGPHVSSGQNTLHLNSDGPSSSQDEGCTLRILHERVYDARLSEDALTCALLSFEETDDVRAYEEALATALRLNITIDSQGIRPRELRERFHNLAVLATAIDRLIRGHSTIHDTDGYHMTILHLACAAGFAGLLEPLFWRGASIDVIDNGGETPLRWAIRSGDLDTVRFALSLGSDPDAGCPLILAPADRRHAIMAALVKHGADINKTFGDNTNLEWAIHEKNLDDVRFVLSLGADPNLHKIRNHPILRVFQGCVQSCDNCDHEEIALVLMEHGADIFCRDFRENTIFHLAVREARVRFLRAALAKITSPVVLSATDENGWTALHYAASTSKEQLRHQTLTIVPMLLKAGADVNARTAEDFSVLGLAVRDGCERLIKLLLDAGAEVNTPPDHKFSALIVAAIRGEEGVLRLLIDAGADVNSRRNGSHSALGYAARDGHEEIVRLLLDVGADVNASPNHGLSALTLAAGRGEEGVVRLLIDAGADVNLPDEDGYSALIVAATEGHESLVRLLLNARANVNLRTISGGSALIAAARYGYEGIVRILIDAGAEVDAQTTSTIALS